MNTPDQTDHYDVRSISTLVDLTGDGLIDLVWKVNPGTYSLSQLWQTVDDDDPLYLYRGNGTGFGVYGQSASLGRILNTAFEPNIQYLARSFFDSTQTTFFQQHAFPERGLQTPRSRLFDYDQDGRPDLLEQSWDKAAGQFRPLSLYTNMGGAFLSAPSLSATLAARLDLETIATDDRGGEYRWLNTKDLLDLDGDGLFESWQFDPVAETVTSYRDSSDQPLRAMRSINNGRGAVTTITYASSANAEVVIQDAAIGKAVPTPMWVVESLSTSDQWDPDVATTSYKYVYPVWNEDPRQDWGFRGFEEVTTTSPAGALVEERFDYELDWSGRLKTSITYAAETPTNPNAISESTWAPYNLFGGVLRTFHATAERKWTCSNGQTESACRASPSAFTLTSRSWAPKTDGSGVARLNVTTYEYLQDGEIANDGDRYTFTGYALLAGDGVYRLQTTTHALLQYSGNVPTWQDYELWTFDAGNRHPTAHRRFFNVGSSGSPDYGTSAVTTWTYYSTGQRQAERLPNQQPSGPQVVFAYDATHRFVVSTTNQKGHVVTAEHEPGTGAQVWQAGPNQSSCGVGCVNTEQQWTDVDGLGRSIATYVNRSNGAAAWVKTKVGESVYVDSVIAGARTKYIERSLVSYSTSLWTETETQLDGRGRPDVVNVKTGATSPVATTTYDYDGAGKLVALSIPDPSAAPGQVAYVTHLTSYDSLGRPVAIRRPSIGMVAAGSDLSYDGVRTQVDEVAGSQGGPVGRTVSFVDGFGRLIEVREYTDLATNAYATTFYLYDAGDRVRRVQNADGVITDLAHDFAGRRLSIQRSGRLWRYTYDKNGNMVSEAQPSPSVLEELEYTNIFQYDELNRVTQRQVGGRSMTLADRTLLGIGSTALGYDTCTNGVGRLCSTTHPSNVLTLQYGYDPEGNRTSESMTFAFGGVTGTRSTSYTFGPGGRLIDTYYADNASTDPSSKTRSTLAYDDRGLPSTLTWTPASGGAARTVAAQTRNVGGVVTVRTATLAGLGNNWRNFSSTFTYDKIGRVTSQTVTSPQPAATYASQVLTYFGQDDPATLAHTVNGTTYTFSYGYSPRHELLSTTEAQGRYSAAFTHTAGGKLATAMVGGTAQPGGATFPRNVSYQYAAAVDPEAPSALINIGSATELRGYSYDSVGSQTEVRAGGSATDRFVYDGDDQLRRAEKLASGSVTGIEEYYYDADGQRRGVVTRNAAGSVTGARVFIGGAELELTATGAINNAFAYLAMGTPVAKVVSPSGGWTTTSASNTASVIELQYHGVADNTLLSVQPTGAVQAAFVYGPYGDVIRANGASSTTIGAQRRRFNDKFRDDLTGLSYYGVRYYDPLLLSWTQADPMYRFVPDAAWGDPRLASLYAFVAGNPMRYLDPDGRTGGATAAATLSGCSGRVSIVV